jgi:hypothetical protein
MLIEVNKGVDDGILEYKGGFYWFYEADEIITNA